MDKVRPVIQWVKKNHFWVACGLITTMILLAWVLATGSLRSDLTSRMSKIESGFQSGKRIKAITNHPNPTSHEVISQEITAKRDEVAAAWALQFDRQQSILVWPEELPEDLRQQGRELFPIEAKVAGPSERDVAAFKEIAEPQRDIYQKYIQNHIPKLADIVRSKWNPAPVEGKDESRFLVDWMGSDQSNLATTRFGWTGVPSTLDVMYAQEDLWVIRQILEIVRQTNGDAEARYKAPIKTIKSIALGKDVGKIEAAGSVATGGVATAGTGVAGSGGTGGGGGGTGGEKRISVDDMIKMQAKMMGKQGGGGNSNISGSASKAAAADPWDDRYVTEEFKGVSADQIRKALRSKTPTDAQLVVAKRLPVRIELLIDQRKLNRFIAICGNAQLPLEIRQVRLNRSSSGGFSTSEAGGGGGMGAGGGMGGMGGMGGGGGGINMESLAESLSGMAGGGGAAGSGAGGAGAGGMSVGKKSAVKALPKDQSPYDVPVEVLGIVYLYNPVDMEKLGASLEKPAAKEKTPPADSKGTPAAQPTPDARDKVPNPESAATGSEPAKKDTPSAPAKDAGPGDGKTAAAGNQPAG